MRQTALRAAAAILAMASAPLVAQTPGDTVAVPVDTTTHRIDAALPAGRIIQRIVSRADTSQRYALYLPSTFARDRQWPILFLLDPRGRAMVPMQRFQPPAERLGYIVISSYNTLSDGPPQPNYKAMAAMLADVQRSLPVSSRRLYLVGFSGTSRFAWELSPQLTGSVAGIISAGASVPGGSSWIRANIGKSSPVVFGTMGMLDMNYEELRTFDAELDAIGTPHHIERFEGGHQWPPTELATRSVEWLTLQAMRRGLEPRDQPWIDSLYTSWLARANRFESTSDTPAAAREYRFVRADFDGLTDIGAAVARLSTLERDSRVRKSLDQEHAAADRDARLSQALAAFLSELRNAPSPPSFDQARKRLELDALRRDSARTDDASAAIVARRALERIFVQMSFYAPREFLEARRYAHAATALQVARSIKPADGGTCFWLARALAQTGDKPGALQALECAMASRQVTPAAMAGDSLLAPLRGEARYQALLKP